jgi:hypothetical protein
MQFRSRQSYGKGTINLDAEISDGTFDLSVTEQLQIRGDSFESWRSDGVRVACPEGIVAG